MARSGTAATAPGTTPSGANFAFPTSTERAAMTRAQRGGAAASTETDPISAATSALMSNVPTFDPEKAIEYATRLAELQRGNFPGDTQLAYDVAKQRTEDINRYMGKTYYSRLDYALPNWRDTIAASTEALDATKKLASEMIRGELPDDVKDFIMRTRAELGLSQGRFGEAQSMATARDLGRTSLDLTQAGATLYTEAVSPLAGRLLAMGQSVMAPTADLSALYGAHLNALMGATTISPTSAMQTSAQIGVANAENAWNARLSAFNAQMDQYQLSMQQQMLSQALSSQERQAWINAFTRLGGTAGTIAAMG